MKRFRYKAINAKGKMVSEKLDVSSEEDFLQRVAAMEMELISYKEVTYRAGGIGKQKVTRRELIDFCFYLEQMLRAGVPILDALEDMRLSMNNEQLKEATTAIINTVKAGKTLSEAMADYPKIFDEVFISLVRVGESSGQLNKVLLNVTETLKWQDELISQTQKALMYPMFAGVVVTGVVFFLMIYLVPQMVDFIQKMGEELPFHTKALIAVSNFISNYWYLVLGVPVLMFFTIKYLARTNPKVRFEVDRNKLRVWLMGPIINKIIISRFTNYFALMYASGVTVLECLVITENIVGNVVIRDGIRQIAQRIEAGETMGDSFAATELFPPLVIRMIRVGEGTGQLDNALMNVCYFYNRDVKESIEKMQQMIEPMMTVTLGLILGWVMISVLGPVYDLISKIKT